MIKPARTHRPKMRTSEAALYCGSTASTFNKLRLTGEGPVYMTIGRTVVYDPDDLDDWLHRRRRKSTSAELVSDLQEDHDYQAQKDEPSKTRWIGNGAVGQTKREKYRRPKLGVLDQLSPQVENLPVGGSTDGR